MNRPSTTTPAWLRRLARLPFLAVRRLRWARGAWSKDSDRSYHEQLYEAQDYDPFRADYPGYVTIRRFADHVEPLIPAAAPGPGAGPVLDVGCGPGEITCELARRHPRVSFVGIDHSARAIERATRNAARLGLTNVRFAVGDAEQLPPQDTYGLVTMFDAFHHLERPRDFLAWLRAHTTRCVLIEPAGTWSGRWARGLDVDWLLADLANIRDRLEALSGDGAIDRDRDGDGAIDRDGDGDGDDDAASGNGRGAIADAQAAMAGARAGAGLQVERGEGAVERRYALEDFEGFFTGWQLRITGTIAGFDTYPPSPHGRSALRPVVGDIAYQLICATEERMQQHDRDGAAKHWVIAATSDAGVIEPRLPHIAAGEVEPPPASTVASAFDVRYERYEGPTRVKAGTQFRATIEIRNAGWDEWRSDAGAAVASAAAAPAAATAAADHPVRVSYHWLTTGGEMKDFDGLRTDLPRPIGPNDTCRVFVTVAAPAAPGDYLIAFDLVKEGVTWFSEAGMPWHTVAVHVHA